MAKQKHHNNLLLAYVTQVLQIPKFLFVWEHISWKTFRFNRIINPAQFKVIDCSLEVAAL